MPTTIQITTDNYNGQTAIITFTPDNGGPVVNLGSQVLPYDYNSDYYYGTYSLYFPAFDTTCTLVIAGQTPTPTNTPTPTITPTITPTPSPTLPKQYYVYKICDRDYYVIQTLPVPPINGVSLNPNNAFKFGNDIDGYFCYEYLYTTTNPNPFPPGTDLTNFTGNYFTPVLNTIFTNCTSCNSLPRCTTVIFTVGGVNPLCNSGLPSYGHAAVEWTDCDGFPQTHTFGGSMTGTQYQVCALTNGNVITAGQPYPDFICGYGTVTDTGQSCTPLLPLKSFYYEGFGPPCPDPIYHPEINNWVKYLDENGIENTFIVGCSQNGCQEIMASSIVDTNRVQSCTP